MQADLGEFQNFIPRSLCRRQFCGPQPSPLQFVRKPFWRVESRCQIPWKGYTLPCLHRCHREVRGKDLALKIPLKLMKATIIINIFYKNSKHRNPPPFRLVWAWEMGHSQMSLPVPKEGLCWSGLDSKWQVIWRSRCLSASWRRLGVGPVGVVRVFIAQWLKRED